VRISRRHIRRAPTGGMNQMRSLSHRLGAPRIRPQLRIELQVGPQRVPAGQRRGHAENHRLIVVLFLEGAEQPVPEDEHTAVVAIHVARFCAWWARWLDGVINTHSNQPSLGTWRVCTQN
jgi:hypothetical protein